MTCHLGRLVAVFTLLAATALAAGCAGPQAPQPGATQAQVEAQLGRPRATFPLPDGGRQVEFNYVRGANTFIVFFDAAGKVVEAVQALNETNFRQVRPGMSQEQVLRLIGHPFETVPGGRRVGQTWNYPFSNPFCQQFQVQFAQGDAEVATAGFTLLPACMSAPS